MTHDAIPVSIETWNTMVDELARLRECEARCVWLLPIVTGENTERKLAKTLALAQALLSGMNGNDAVDAARKVVP